MTTYLIAVTDGIDNVLKTIEEKWPDRYYYIEPNLLMLSAPGISSPSTIKEKLGLSTDKDAPSGLIIPLERYTTEGVLSKAAVDWYKEATNG